MTIANTYIVFSVLVLFVIAAMFILGNRFKKNKKLSPLAGLASAFIVVGIFFGNNRILGFSLLAVGVILAIGDIIVKARSGRGRREM
jgi:drug/metabolite transporter (DMT)-like permease